MEGFRHLADFVDDRGSPVMMASRTGHLEALYSLLIPVKESSMSARNRVASLAITCLIAGAATSAHAALVRSDFTGTNSSPGAANIFGTPVTDLGGYLIYDDAATGSTFSTTATNYSGAIRELSFSIGSGGNSVFSGVLSGGSFGSA